MNIACLSKIVDGEAHMCYMFHAYPKAVGGEVWRGATVRCIPTPRRKKINFPCNIHSQSGSLGALHTYVPAQAMVQAAEV